MRSDNLAQKAIKISISCLFLLLILGMILISIILVQIDSIAQMNQKIETLEKKIEVLGSAKSKIFIQ